MGGKLNISKEDKIKEIRKIKKLTGCEDYKLYKVFNKIEGKDINSINDLNSESIDLLHDNIIKLYFKYKIVFTLAAASKKSDNYSKEYLDVITKENSINEKMINYMIEGNKKRVVGLLIKEL